MQPEKRCTHCGESKVLDEFTKHPNTKDHRGSWCKQCTRVAAARIRQERPEQIRIQTDAWRARNAERLRTYRQARYSVNRERLKAESRARRAFLKAHGLHSFRSAKSLARRRTYMQTWTRKNTEKLNAYHREYYALKPSIVKGWQHNRRARILGTGGRIGQAEWVALCATYDHRCLSCGEKRPLTVDHVIPLSRGGRHAIDNVQPLCKSCNSKKHDRTIDYRLTAGSNA